MESRCAKIAKHIDDLGDREKPSGPKFIHCKGPSSIVDVPPQLDGSMGFTVILQMNSSRPRF
jgi:hypothetical protein